MKNKQSIAIYSGAIPSTTFVENLIEGVSKTHQIYLFGKKKKNVLYGSKNVKQFPIFNSISVNFILTLFRFLQLCFYPKRVKVLLEEIKKYDTIYEKLNWLIRYTPVLLHLPTIFHVQWAKDIEYWFFLQEELDVPVVLSLRGAHVNYSPIVDEKLAKTYGETFPKLKGFHAVSKAIGIEAQKYGAKKENIKVIHSSIKKTTFQNYVNSMPNSNDSVFKILSIGRYHWIKGYEEALSAMKLLKDKGIQFQYDIIASGDVLESLVYLKKSYGLDNEVHFLPAKPQNELFIEMKKYNILLLPSLEEGIANVVLEAMAIGLPVISTNCGGMEEVIKNNVNGWIVPRNNPKEMVNTIEAVSNSLPSKIKEIKENAHKTIVNEFHEDKIIREFVLWYNQIFKD